MDRVGMSTVNFRNRFAGTKDENYQFAGFELVLKEVPAYFADRYKLHNVELWSKHFTSTDRSYLKQVKKALRKSKSRLINIQLDEDYQLGAADQSKRKESLELVLRWVNVAKFLGSGAIRINPGKGNVSYLIDALKTVNQVAKKKGIIMMTENHYGMEMDLSLIHI